MTEKSEQEIIDELVSDHIFVSRRDGSTIWARKLCISVAQKALQKGKELGAEKAYTCSCEFGCNPCHALCNKCAVFGQAQKASKIKELEKENKELLETLQSVLCQACESRAATDTEPPEYDSMALSAYADGLRLLSKYKRFRIHDESGRRVIGYMR